MFEAHVLHLLRLYLGEYVRGLSLEALKISVWKGDVVLKDLQLKAEALNALKLPITVKAGFLGSVTLKVPWNRLGKEPVIVLLDRIFVLAEPLQDEKSFARGRDVALLTVQREDVDKWFEAKRRRCEEAELAMLETKDRRIADTEDASDSNSWFGSLVATIVGNLKISITNLHIRYEDLVSNPGHPFCSGISLAKLAAVTVDEVGAETFVSSGALDRLHKSVRLERLAVYHDSNSKPWKTEKSWEAMTPEEWSEVFEVGIISDALGSVKLTNWASGRQYLLHPVGGLMQYHRHGKREKRSANAPFQEASLVLEPVSLTVLQAQYCDGMKLLEGMSRYRTRLQYSQFRPQVPVSEDPRSWWLYGCQSVLQQQSKVWYKLRWKKIVYLCQCRRKYVQLYAKCLRQGFQMDSQEIRDMEKELDVEVILLWRLLAHAKVEGAKSKEAAKEREKLRNSSWWSFGWGTMQSSQTPTIKREDAGVPGYLTKDEWSKINNLLSYQPGHDSVLVNKQEAANMMQIALDVSIQQASATVVDSNGMEILCGTFENLRTVLKVYEKTVVCDLKLQFYGLSAPEGVLIESVSREGRDHALTTMFVHLPFEEPLDWKLSATMSPCHVTVWRLSFERFLQFLKSSQALSPGVALESVAVLQSKLEEVTRRAQEQLQIVLEKRSRFTVDLDLDAPKITIPSKATKIGGPGTRLLLDLGHFTLHTAHDASLDAPQDACLSKADLYSRFHISGNEISAFLVEGDFQWSQMDLLYAASVPARVIRHDKTDDLASGVVLPVIDRCGMSLVFDQIRVEHPSYPSTRLAIKVPRLGIHFSPAIFQQLMLVLKAVGGIDKFEGCESKELAATLAPWHSADHSGDVWILLWGIHVGLVPFLSKYWYMHALKKPHYGLEAVLQFVDGLLMFQLFLWAYGWSTSESSLVGIGSAVAEWQPCWAVLAGTFLYILESETAQTYQRCSSLTGKQVVELPSASIGGFECVLAVCDRGIEIQKVIESSTAVVMRFRNVEQKGAWIHYITLAIYKASALLSLPLRVDWKSDASEEEDVCAMDPAKQPNLFVMGLLQELQLSVSTSTNVTHADSMGEERLIFQLQANGGKMDLLLRPYDLCTTIKLHSLNIVDKIQGDVSPSCQYLARSGLAAKMSDEDGRFSKQSSLISKPMDDEEEVFDDALMDFSTPASSEFGSHASFFPHNLSYGTINFRGADDDFTAYWGPQLHNLVKEGDELDCSCDESEVEGVSDFVNMRLVIQQTESPDYNGTDVQVSLRMATLDFFCNRPTVVALMELGTELSESFEGKDLPAQVGEVISPGVSPEAVVQRDIVKGLLGRGKSRVMFRLKMDMESARIFMNKEDGLQIAMLAQEKFEMDLKVYPSSLAISGTLGNLRVCDMSLGRDHHWGWLCDIRDPGARSLVELEFKSFNKDDDDYKGFDYCLSGRLSAVRLVFLYRFIQEITAYFVALATPQVHEVVTVVDKMGGIEKLILQSDLEGFPAVKLDFSLDTPIIIIPRCSNSQEFMQLDLGQLEVHNSFEWHGGEKSDTSAVHVDVLFAEMTGINMVVGIEGQPGKGMIQEARGLQVKVQRPLRDLFKKVPEVTVDVQVLMLRGVLSDKEYLVIIDCAATNVGEPPNLPPPFRGTGRVSEATGEEGIQLELPTESESEWPPASGGHITYASASPSWTKVRASIDVRHAELELYISDECESALARVEIEQFWLTYCSSSANNMDILVTLPKFSVLDQRPDTKPEMRLMVGSMEDLDTTGACSDRLNLSGDDRQSEVLVPQLTMLVMDLRLKPDSQAIVLRLQRPRLLVVVDFLFAVGKFFVPTLGTMTGRNGRDQNDSFSLYDHIHLSTSPFLQEEETVILSSDQRLLADALDIEEFVYDGCGRVLVLDVKDDAIDSLDVTSSPLIMVGCNKKLRFKNVCIKNGFRLNECIHLSTDSSYSASPEDGVIMEGIDVDGSGWNSRQDLWAMKSPVSTCASPIKGPNREQKITTSVVNNFVVDVQAIAPELTFYDSRKWPSGSSQRERVLRAKLDCYLMVASKGEDKWISGLVKGLTVEGGQAWWFVDPLDISVEYRCVKDKITLTVGSSDICIRLSFNVISLVLRLHDDALSTFWLSGAPPLSRCTHFDRIWMNNSGSTSSQQVTFWRPRAPPGYVIMGDCATSGVAPPSQAVLAISNIYQHSKKPLSFDLVWSSHGDGYGSGKTGAKEEGNDSDHCCVWMPIAPPGYLALGCVAERGSLPPPLSIVQCIQADLVTSGAIIDCIFYSPSNDRFYAHSSTNPPPRLMARDLCEMLLNTSSMDMERRNTGPNVRSGVPHLDSLPSLKSNAGRHLITTPQFDRIWWDKGSEVRCCASIWRPVAPAGYATVGDCLVEGLEPPGVGVVLRDEHSGRLAKPLRYLQCIHTTGKGVEDAIIWFPVAPAGYVALGCVATKSPEMPSLNLVRCLRMDLVTQAQLSKKATWWLSTERTPNSVGSMSGSRNAYGCSLWKVENQACTFIARPDLKRPPGRMAYALAEVDRKETREGLSAEAKICRVSITIFDDSGGLMTPLVDLTVKDINLAAHGRMEAMSTVLITNMAASTFNTHLESWEPFIEPFEGIFKYESYDVDSEATLKVGKRIRITAANVVNMNVTSAGLEMLVGAVLSWQKQMDLEQQARMVFEMEGSDYKNAASESLSSALEKDDSEKLMVENKLACDLYLRTFKDNFEQVDLLSADNTTLVTLPPPSFPDRFINASETQQPRHFVAIQVSEARDLSVNVDGNGQDYMCALRLATIQLQEEQKPLPQSARSRCVQPTTNTEGLKPHLAAAKWNEVFIFEIPRQGSTVLEVLVTNQAAKGGTGQAVGGVSIPINEHNGSHTLQPSSQWNVVRQALNQGPSTWPTAERKVFPLLPPGQTQRSEGDLENRSCGSITVSMYHFVAKGHRTRQGALFKPKDDGRSSDVGLWFALNPQGPWTSIDSVLPPGTITKEVSDRKLALEVTMQEGHKCVKVRSLIMVSNSTDITLAVCICPFSLLKVPDGLVRARENHLSEIIEEVFENQRYQPLGGWGSRWPGHLMPTDPSRWSNRDYSKASQEFPEPPLPRGWVWTSSWSIDKTGYVDIDGWFYGADFQSLKFPPTSIKSRKKSTFDFARRRRLVRTRQCVPENRHIHTRQMVGEVQPGASIFLPWGCIEPRIDMCVQVRPHSDSSQCNLHWGQAISHTIIQSRSQDGGESWPRNTIRLTKSGVPVSSLLLKELEKTEEILLCKPLEDGCLKGTCWLNLDADATVLYSELNAPIYDWRLTVNAPLKVENQLPCAAEYIVWEKPINKENPIKQQHGIVAAGGSTYIYSVDVRRPVYLTWLAQGGWKLEKEAVLISDPSMEELPSGFWMFHQQSGRRLRVSLEHDFGSTSMAAKNLRLFVPYWLCNDASLPLAYRLVEIEPTGGSVGDTTWLTRAAKAAKQASRRPNHTRERKLSQMNKVVQHLETIEDSLGVPVMLSLQAYSDRLGGLSLSSRTEDGLLSPRLGLAIGITDSNMFNYALPFRDFENSMERMDLKAVDALGEYYRLSIFLDMSCERTKVVHMEPHTLFINRLGQTLHLGQDDLIMHEDLLHPGDPPKALLWQSDQQPELLQICIEGYKWSNPFSVDTEGKIHIGLRGKQDGRRLVICAEVRKGVKGSRFFVVFRLATRQSPYRVENRSAVLPFRFRQAGSCNESWQLLTPGSAASFAWEDLGLEHLLEMLVDGCEPVTSVKYNIDELVDYQPTPTVRGGPVAALQAKVFQEGMLKVIRVADWKPSNEDLSIVAVGVSTNPLHQEPISLLQGFENQFHTIIELAEFGLSIIDHTPEELLYVSIQNLVLSFATGLGSGTKRLKMRLDNLQVDCQLPLTPMPVLFIAQESGHRDFLLKCTITEQDIGVPDCSIYPYIGIQGPSVPNVSFLVNIHEPIIWRLHEMFWRLNLGRLRSSQTTAVAVDPIIRIGLLHTSEIHFKVTLAMAPAQRPRGILGFWSTLITSLGNTDEMPIRITPRVHEDVSMRRSALWAATYASIRNDLLSQPFLLLTGVDILGNTSSALGNMSKGVAALSMDKKFIRGRQKQANVEDIGDGIREGGEALAKGLFRGVTGIVTKPFEGARSSGMEGFLQGVGKGVIGVAIQPMSGVLDLLSKTTEGANAMRIKLAAAITLEQQLLRRRLPRAIGGDNVLRPFDAYKARGQVLMQLAEQGTIFGPMDFFRVRGKFAMSDAYEDHFNLPKSRTLMITHRRVILLQHPTSLMQQKKPDLLKEPCTVTWNVTWDELMTLELALAKEEPLHLPPSRLLIHLRNWSQDSRLFDSKEIARLVNCHPGTKQAVEIRAAIQRAYDSYGPGSPTIPAQGMSSARKPYAGAGEGAASGAALGLLAGPAAPIAVPVMATFGALIGTASQAMLDTESELLARSETRDYHLSSPNDHLKSPMEGTTGRFIADFHLMWWDKGAPWSKKFQVSIWRPVAPTGISTYWQLGQRQSMCIGGAHGDFWYVLVGDVVQSCHDPPDMAMVYRNNHDGQFSLPEGFDLVWRDTESGARKPVTIWRPRPPQGYVAIGCVVVPDYYEPDRAIVSCVRQDRVGNVPLGQIPLWRDYTGAALWPCSLWRVQNDSRTFLARRDHQAPPSNLAFTVLS